MEMFVLFNFAFNQFDDIYVSVFELWINESNLSTAQNKEEIEHGTVGSFQ